MPDSPLKRVTRSRAKVDITLDLAPVKPVRVSAKRKLRSEDEETAAAAELVLKPAKGKQRKAVVPAEVTVETEEAPLKPTRGRTRKLAAPVPEEPQPKRAARRTTAQSSAPPTKAAPKKRVTFQVDAEKENQEPKEGSSRTTKKPVRAASLLKSKPVRRPAGSRITRTCKPAIQPLSPKKSTNILASPDIADPVEAPAQSFIRSPAKRPVTGISLTGPAKPQVDPLEDDLGTNIVRSPIKAFSVLGSPAKRMAPTASPIKASPQKIRLETETTPPKIHFPTRETGVPVFKLSLLDSPAKRLGQSPVRSQLAKDPFTSPSKVPTFSFSRSASPVKDLSTQSLSCALPSPVKCEEKLLAEEQLELQEPSTSCDSAEIDKGTIYEEFEEMEVDAVETLPTEIDAPEAVPFTFEKFASGGNIFAEALGRNKLQPSRASSTPTIGRSGGKAFDMHTPLAEDLDDSEDELTTAFSVNHSPTLFINRRQSVRGFVQNAETVTLDQPETEYEREQIVNMTPLVFRFGNMGLMSPSKKGLGRSKRDSILSPIPPETFYGEPSPVEPPSPAASFFSEAMKDMELSPQLDSEPNARLSLIPELAEDVEEEDSIQSCDSEKENNSPDVALHAFIHDSPVKHVEVPLETPKRNFDRDFYTVQKVPLKPAAEQSPLKIRKRRGSISGPSMSQDHRTGLSRSKTVISYSPEKRQAIDMSEGVFEDICAPIALIPETPIREQSVRTPLQPIPLTPANQVDCTTLTGVVAYVDVHTAEGADASGVFVELLTQMGARCVKQWNWNGRETSTASPVKGFGLGGPANGFYDPGLIGTPGGSGQGTGKAGSKVGVTHVIFKDGGVRTLEKVREAGNIVSCVSAAWVLDCEREGRWVDESQYAVDTSMVPRGGNRRRKSMEPRALSALENMSPMKGEIPEKSPAKPAASFETPAREYNYADIESSMSPTTPYFLKPDQLIQRTCPPKQKNQPMFPVHSKLQVENEESVRQRLLMARRKTMQFAPKIGSPLVRNTSFTIE